MMNNNFIVTNENTQSEENGGILSSISSFFKKCFSSFSRSLGEKGYYYLSFAVPIVVLYLVFICLGMFPFGSRSILTLDMDGQYVYFFEQIRDVYTGDASIFYTFERALGGEFLGYFTYYLASPLSLLVVIFPKTMITEAIMTMILVKTGLSGLTFSIYLKKTRKLNSVGFVIFSTMYALCSYASLYQFNTMWHDAMVWLPLIVLGIESLVIEGKFKLFTISLALAICSNYYVGYMLCFFVAIYFFFFIAAKGNDEINPSNETYHRLKSLVRIGVFSAIALMMAAAIILSAYYALQFGKSSYQDNSFDSEMRFDLLHLFSKLFAGSYDTVRPEGTPNIYSGLLCLLTVPVFYMSKKIKPREKALYTVLVIIFVASFSLTFIDLVWHGFQAPVWFNHRYSFMFSFILLSMAYKGFEEIDSVSIGFFGKISAVLILMLFIIQKTVILVRYDNTGSGWEAFHTTPSYGMVWLSIGCLLAYLLVFVFKKHTGLSNTASVLLVIVVLLEMFFNTLINWNGVIDEGGCASRENYRTYAEKIELAAAELELKDTSFYRTELAFQRKLNDNFLGDINGLTEFTSTFNQSNVLFMKKLGFYTAEPTIRYMSGNPVADSILGVKYIIGSESEDTNDSLPGLNSVSGLYSACTTKNGFVIYENPYALPIAYTVDKNMNNSLLEKEFFEGTKSPFNNMNMLFSSMLGTDVEVFESCYEYSKSNSTITKTPDDKGGISYYKKSGVETGNIYFNITAKYDGNVYMYMPSPYSTYATVSIGKTTSTKDMTLIVSDVFTGENDRVLDLGYYKAGDKFVARISFSQKNRIYLWDTEDYFVQVNPNTLKEATDTLKAGGLVIDEYSDTNITGTVSSSIDGTVFTTIPYDENWRVYVDGERVETYELADAMIGFDISKGEHTIEFSYVHTPFIAGAIISAFAIALFVFMCILDSRYKKGQKISFPISCNKLAVDDCEDESSCEELDVNEATFEEKDEFNEEISEENNDIPS